MLVFFAESEENALKGGIQAMLININKKDGGKRLKDNAINGMFYAMYMQCAERTCTYKLFKSVRLLNVYEKEKKKR